MLIKKYSLSLLNMVPMILLKHFTHMFLPERCLHRCKIEMRVLLKLLMIKCRLISVYMSPYL